MNIAGKVAVVTGGASGLGYATVKGYAAKGARIAVFDRDEQRGRGIVDEIGADRAAFYAVDVSSEASVGSAVESVIEQFGAIHICNNFAGIGIPEKTLGKDSVHSLANYQQVIDVNLVGTFNVCRLVAEQMKNNAVDNGEECRGVITNTASVAAYEGQVGQVAYSASKGGVVSMTLPMARDLAAVGIRVNTIVPGLFHTPLFDTLPDTVYRALEASVVNPQRLGRPDEVAHLAVMIVENDYMNGESIRLDGAIRMQPR